MPTGHAQPSHANADADVIARHFDGAQRVVVLTHAKPDGDAVGSSLALVKTLALLGKDARAWYFGPLPPWIRRLASDDEARFFEPPFAHLRLSEEPDCDAVAITDTAAWSQLEPAHDWVRARAARACVIDHHVQGTADVAGLRLVDVAAAAVVQPVCDVCVRLLGLPSPATLPTDIAEMLYLGLATDTGWFKHSNVTPGVMRLAADLLEAGANHVKLFGIIEQNDTPGRLALVSKSLATLDMRQRGQLAMMHISLDDLRASGAMPGETGGLTDFTQSLAGVAVSAMFVQTAGEKPGEGVTWKISMRSKSEPTAVDVSVIAAQLAGGGHVRAAGAKVKGSIEHAKAVIEEHVAKQLARA